MGVIFNLPMPVAQDGWNCHPFHQPFPSSSAGLLVPSAGLSKAFLSLQVIVDTPTSPVTSGIPLFFVITVTAIKQVQCQRGEQRLLFETAVSVHSEATHTCR